MTREAAQSFWTAKPLSRRRVAAVDGGRRYLPIQVEKSGAVTVTSRLGYIATRWASSRVTTVSRGDRLYSPSHRTTRVKGQQTRAAFSFAGFLVWVYRTTKKEAARRGGTSNLCRCVKFVLDSVIGSTTTGAVAGD